MTAGSLCVHAGFSQESASVRISFEKEGMEFFLRSFFYLLITSVKSCVSLHSFKVDTDQPTIKPAGTGACWWVSVATGATQFYTVNSGKLGEALAQGFGLRERKTS